MRVFWIVMMLFFAFIFPKILRMDSDEKLDHFKMRYQSQLSRFQIKDIEHFNRRAEIIFTLLCLLLCFLMGNLTGADSTIENIVYYYKLRDGGEEYLGRSYWAWDIARIKSDYREKYQKSYYGTEIDSDYYDFDVYSTRKLVNESFILKIAQNEYTEVFKNIELVKTDKNHWTVYSGEELLGYAESQGGFFLKQIVFLMYYDKIHAPPKPFTPEEKAKMMDELHRYLDELEEKEKNKNIFDTVFDRNNAINIKLFFLIVLVLCEILPERKKKNKGNENNNGDESGNPNPAHSANENEISQQSGIYHVYQLSEESFEDKNAPQDKSFAGETPVWKPPESNENGESGGQAYTSQQWKPQAHMDYLAEQNKWNEINPKWDPNVQPASKQGWNGASDKSSPVTESENSAANKKWKQNPVWGAENKKESG